MNYPVSGAGLGLRRSLIPELESLLLTAEPLPFDFMEIAPENWIGVGGRLGRKLRQFTERVPVLCHGLSLSIGGPDPLDEDLVRAVRDLMRAHQMPAYSEHLSYCSAGGHLYDLMPLPYTDEAVTYVAERILRVQDILGQSLIIENVSTYAEPGKQMEEAEFVRAVVERADCRLLLDVNNVYVNCFNHGGDPYRWIASMPSERIAYLHVAGHYDEAEDLLVDTHGMPVKADVWDLLAFTWQTHGRVPTLLERDFNFPPLAELVAEVDQIKALQGQVAAGTHAYPMEVFHG